MNVRQATSEDRGSWDRFVLGHPAATPYHLTAWSDAVEQAYGHRGFRLVAEGADGIEGVLPLTLMRLPLGRRRLVSLPFCDLGGVLARSGEAGPSLLRAAADLARDLNAPALEFRCGAPEPTLEQMGFAPREAGGGKVRMILDLPPAARELFDSFKSKLRSQIRKAEKNELVFTWGGRERLDDFYDVFSVNMRDLGSPVHGRGLFEALLVRFAGRARLGLVLLGERAVAAGVMLLTDRSASVPWASARREHHHLAPNMLLYWGFLSHAADSGCELFDFGRSSVDEGTYRFKAQWGARATPLHWYERGAARRGVAGAGADSSRRALAAAVWRRLPLPLANLLGPRLRKHISL